MVMQREENGMSQHGGVSREDFGGNRAQDEARTRRIDSVFTGLITPFSVMIPAISAAGVTSKAGL